MSLKQVVICPIYKMSTSKHEAESFEICNASLQDWISIEISQTLLEELPDIIK